MLYIFRLIVDDQRDLRVLRETEALPNLPREDQFQENENILQLDQRLYRYQSFSY